MLNSPSSTRGLRSPFSVLLFLLLLVFHVPCSVRGDVTACDGDDGGIANCCAGDSTTSTCEACRVGYGLVKNSCLKCKNPKCAYCNGNPNTCKSSDQYSGPIPHCSTSSYVDCIECDDGYTLSKDSRSCIKCSIKNCAQCSNDGKSCATCKDGYGYDKKAKACSACSVSNCDDCSKDITKCSKCGYDFRSDTNYGLVNGKCVPCADPQAVTCDNNKVSYCRAGYYVDKASNSCKACVSPCISCESAKVCLYCDYGYDSKAVNGKCVPSEY